MAPDDIIRVIFGLLAVIGLIGIAAIAARKAGLLTAAGGLSGHRRLSVTETLSLDARRKLVILKCDDREHLVILGAQSETMLDDNLNTPARELVDTPNIKNPFAELRAAFGKTKAKGADAA